MPVVQHVTVGEDGSLELLEGEECRLTQSEVLHDSPFCSTTSPGTLVVTNQRVVWINNESPTKGSSYHFRDISLHAIASVGFDNPCIYCHLDTENVTEVTFTPTDSSTLQAIYDVFSRGALDNPDIDEEEPTDAWIGNLDDDDIEEINDGDNTDGRFDDP